LESLDFQSCLTEMLSVTFVIVTLSFAKHCVVMLNVFMVSVKVPGRSRIPTSDFASEGMKKVLTWTTTGHSERLQVSTLLNCFLRH
jgi:hypothetical protein